MTTATPSRKSTPKPVKVARLHQHGDGIIHGLSSDGVARYALVLGDAPHCTCSGFVNHGHCYHMDTARGRFGAFYSAPWAVIGADTTDPEPPTPAAPAGRRPCACLLYGGSCERCRPVTVAA